MTSPVQTTGNNGGWRGQPGSLAALRPYQGVTGFPARPQCTRTAKHGGRCGRRAVLGSDKCIMHCGARHARTKPATPDRQRARDAARIIQHAERAGTLPGGLSAHQIWRDTSHRDRVYLRPALLFAWRASHDVPVTDPGAWGRALRDAEDAIALAPIAPRKPKPPRKAP